MKDKKVWKENINGYEVIRESIPIKNPIKRDIKTKEELIERILEDLNDDYIYDLVFDKKEFYQRSVTNGKYITYNYNFKLKEDEITDIITKARNIKRCTII